MPNAFPSNQNPNSFPSPLPDLNFSLATPALTPTPRLQHFVHTPPQVCVYDVEKCKDLNQSKTQSGPAPQYEELVMREAQPQVQQVSIEHPKP